MATLGEAVLYLLTDNSKLEAGLGDAEQKTESASAGMAKALGGAIVAGAAVAGSAIIAIGSQAFDMASQVDAATDQISASLGVGVDEAKAYGETIKSIYGNNFGDSIEDVGKSVEVVAKQLKLAGNDPSLKKITENAYRLRDVFGTDVAESVDAVKTLMQNFGVTADEAFDLLADGYQRGLDRSGDFLDTIGEYSVQFRNGGASASQFFKFLETGMQGGVLGTDKAADAFKEFGIRILDSSDLTRNSLKALGISYDELSQGFADGSVTSIDALEQVLYEIFKLNDPIERARIGVGLFGTQWEDLGESTMKSLSEIEEGFGVHEGAIAGLDSKYTNLGSTIEGMWRQFQVGIEPAGEALLALVNENLPAIQGAVALASGAIVHAANGLVDGIALVRKGWDEDWAGIRSTWEKFAAELPKEQEEFWIAWNTAFNAGSKTNATDWEAFLNNIVGGIGRYGTAVIENWTELLYALGATQKLFLDLQNMQWDQAWGDLLYIVKRVGNEMINFYAGVFAPGLKEGMKKGWGEAVDGVTETLQSWWRNTVAWWNNTVGSAFSSLRISDSSLAVINPLNQPSGSQETINGILNGSGTLPLPSANAQSAGGINVTQHFYGQTDPVTVKEASQDGVQRAARTLGMR